MRRYLRNPAVINATTPQADRERHNVCTVLGLVGRRRRHAVLSHPDRGPISVVVRSRVARLPGQAVTGAHQCGLPAPR